MDDRGFWNKAYPEAEQDTPRAVAAAYTSAVKSSAGAPGAAFDAAVRAYRLRHPSASLQVVPRRVAEIICFGGAYQV